jgi:hypothetical protein
MPANKSKLYTAGSSKLWKKTHTFKRVARPAFGFLESAYIRPTLGAFRKSGARVVAMPCASEVFRYFDCNFDRTNLCLFDVQDEGQTDS